MNFLDLLPAIAAVASAVAAIAAVIVTWNAPRSAARFAERLRVENERFEQTKRQKLFIFSEVLKARGVQITREAVGAFNLIDLVYLDSPKVRDAWAELYSAYTKGNMPGGVVEDKMNSLLKAIAEDIGLAENLRPADLERYYYPNALANEDRARSAQLQAVLDSVDLPKEPAKLFPPKPDD